ncbi:glycosyltransferase family 2 protein [Curtobacterium sp. RRHDQ10]|uniref:glycosyltransferase family 2 protein n=1 Tax=Curtobacterium phyllosphaerae TaxID=3413379 RepID=UPI003BF03FED
MSAAASRGGEMVLRRPMTSPSAPEWSGALWVGDVDLRDVDTAARDGIDGVRLVAADGYRRARLLVRRGDTVLGFVEVPVEDGLVDLDALVAETASFDRAAAESAESSAPDTSGVRITVIICTRDRADLLRAALTSVLASDHEAFDVVVVDNAAATTASADLVAQEFDDDRVTLVSEPVPGLSSARNTGLRNATGEIVAYTDDDVVVDPGWLTAIARGFASAPDVELVSGLVPSGELRTPVQRYFDDRVSWSRNLRTRTFRLAEQPADLPMFPFSVGEFGTGANFALRRTTALELGGFDTAFGAGTPTGGGEDLDIFTRVLFAGGALLVDPSAIVWHRHRADLAALRAQGKGYGVGLGAWLTKVALDPTMARGALRRAPEALTRLVGKGAGDLAEGPEHTVDDATPRDAASSTAGSPDAAAAPAGGSTTPTHAELLREVRRVGRLELVSVLLGPVRFLQMRWGGAGLLDHASRSSVGDPGAPATASLVVVRRPTAWGVVALFAAIVGATAVFPVLPEWWRTIALALLTFVGPGAALRTWVSMRPSTTAVVVPGFGLAITVLLTAMMAGVGAWGASGAVLLIAVLSAVAGLDRRVEAGRPVRRTTAYRARESRLERWIASRVRRRPQTGSVVPAEPTVAEAAVSTESATAAKADEPARAAKSATAAGSTGAQEPSTPSKPARTATSGGARKPSTSSRPTMAATAATAADVTAPTTGAVSTASAKPAPAGTPGKTKRQKVAR